MQNNQSYSWTIDSSISGFQLFVFLFITISIIGFIYIAVYKFFSVRKKIQATRFELLNSFDQDRELLSRELHDVVGSFLIPLKATAEKLESNEKSRWDERITTFEKFIKQTSKTIFPEYIYKDDLYSALSKLDTFLSTDQTKLLVFISEGLNMDKDSGRQCFKIILELITNIIKHDKPECILLHSTTEKNKNSFTLTYTSDKNAKILRGSEGLGLKIIEQRLLLIKGYIDRNFYNNESQIILTVLSQE